MKKSALMNELSQLQAQMENELDSEICAIKLLDLLLDYINDVDIRKAVEEVPL